ncbi:MAG: MFS transporter [Clostridiales bacterium]|nr:MFS transporter [Clostridiales bacterium]
MKKNLLSVSGLSAIDFGFAVVSILVSSYLMYFCTDVLVMPVAVVGLIFLIVRIFDGVIDPILGYLLDSGRMRLRKLNAFAGFFALPLSAFTLLLFCSSPVGGVWAIFWRFGLYICWSVCHSIIDIAQMPLLNSVTTDDNRQFFNTCKISASIIGACAASYFTLELAGLLGKGNDNAGFAKAALVFAATSLAAMVLGALCLNADMRIPRRKESFLKAFWSILRERSLTLLILMFLFDRAAMALKTQGAIYFFKYNIGRANIAPTFIMVGVVGSFAAQPLIWLMAKYFKKKTLMTAGYIGSAAAVIATGQFSGITHMMVCNVIYGVASAFPANLIYVSIIERANEMANRNGSGAEIGMSQALLGISGKVGESLASACLAAILGILAYVPDVVQDEDVLLRIRAGFIGLPAAALLFAAAACFFSFVSNRVRV